MMNNTYDYLKRKMLIPMFFLFGTCLFGQVGIQTNSPNASSALDIVATDKGLLIPRVTLTATLSNPSPVTSPATGLLVFNTGANQPVGLYYWNSSAWVMFNAGAISSDYWSLTGNSGTTVGTNFIGTTDAEDFALYTDDTERMRFTSGGQGLIGLTTAYSATDLVTIESNATQDDALRVVAPGNGVRIDADGFGLISFVNNASGYPFYAKNFAASSYGGFSVGSNRTAYTLSSHYAGLSAHGDDGLFTLGQSSTGIGVIAGGNGITTVSTIASGTGGAFSGYHGIYAKAVNSTQGIGFIGVGNNGSTYNTTTNGSGGAFTGYHGLISSSTNTTYGTGVIGVGNGGSYYLYNDGSGHQGSGGAFTGGWCGVGGWADNDDNSSVGVYGYYNGSGSNRDGKGVIGIAAANSGRGYGVYGQGNRYGLWAQGNSGASGTKSFEIDHPLDPEEKTLKHYSIESPEVLNLYRGMIMLDETGNGQVTLPDYFMAININFTYTLTAIGQQAPNIYISKEIDENGNFEISGGNPGQKISWVVYAERNDLYVQKYKEEHENIVEIEKEDEYKGKYLMPELYNQSPEKGMFYTNPTRSAIEPLRHQTIENKVIKTAEPDKHNKSEL